MRASSMLVNDGTTNVKSSSALSGVTAFALQLAWRLLGCHGRCILPEDMCAQRRDAARRDR